MWVGMGWVGENHARKRKNTHYFIYMGIKEKREKLKKWIGDGSGRIWQKPDRLNMRDIIFKRIEDRRST